MRLPAKVWVALGTVYVLWGSTYLGIELTGETIPPLFAVGLRFLVAAALMFAFTALRRGRTVLAVSRRELGACAVVGAMLPGANAILFVAERHVPSGLSALIFGAVPLWLVLLRMLNGDRPPRAALAGVAVGFGGLVILVRPSGGAPLWSLLLVVCSSLLWATGSFVSRKLPLPRDAFAATSYEMLAGGLILLPIGLLTTHPHFAQFSGRSIFGFFYLVVFGSVVGYTAYVWLLDNAPLGAVATYAYVNPVVAIALGSIVLHESLTWTTVIGAALVLTCVAIVVRRETAVAAEVGAAAGAAATPERLRGRARRLVGRRAAAARDR